MYFELQLSSNVFTRIVRNRLKALNLCVDRERKDKNGNLLVLDRVVVGDTTLIQREQRIDIVENVPNHVPNSTQAVWIFSPQNNYDMTVPFLQIKQELNLKLVLSSDLDANGPNPSAPIDGFPPIYAVFNIALNAASPTVGTGGPLTLSYSLAYIDYGVLYFVLSETERNEVQQFIAGVQLPPTTVDLSSLSGLLKRPVAAINAGISCSEDQTLVALRVDFDVYASPPAIDRQFFEGGPKNLLAGKEWAMLIDANFLIREAQTKAKTALQNASKVRLKSGPDVGWDAGGAALNIGAGIELVDACPFFVDNIDMDADVDIRMSFAVQPTNTLKTHYHITGGPSDVGEEIACALTAALLWPFVGPILLQDEDAGAGFGYYLAGLALGPIPTFFGIIAAIETKGLSKDISKDLGSNCTKSDDENYECNDVVNMIMQLSPQFNSKLELETAFGVPEGLVLSGTISNLGDFSIGSVDAVHVKPFTWQLVGRCRSGFSVANKASIIIDVVPPAGMCSAYVMSDPAKEFALTLGDNTVTITPRFMPAYVARPYPCKVRLITNRGVRTITFAPPAAIKDAESQALEIERIGAIASCYKWEKMFTAVERVHWLVDPPEPGYRNVRFWQIVVGDVRPENTIRVEGRDGATVMSAHASGVGVVHMSLLFAGEHAPEDLSLELQGKREESDSRREMSVQQVLFEHRATLPISGDLREMRFEGGARGRRLVVVDGGDEMVWDVTSPGAPTLLRTAAKEQVQGDALVLQTGKEIGGLLTDAMRTALGRLEQRVGRAKAVGAPRVGGIADALYVRGDRSAALFDISRPEEPREIHTYDQPAWFEGVAMGGNLLALHDAASGAVELFVATGKKTI